MFNDINTRSGMIFLSLPNEGNHSFTAWIENFLLYFSTPQKNVNYFIVILLYIKVNQAKFRELWGNKCLLLKQFSVWYFGKVVQGNTHDVLANFGMRDLLWVCFDNSPLCLKQMSGRRETVTRTQIIMVKAFWGREKEGGRKA